MRLTILCPIALAPAANHLAMALGGGPENAGTYGGSEWLDEAGNRYVAASLEVSPMFAQAAGSQLQAPDWDTDGVVDLDAARQAQAAVSIWGMVEGEAYPVASPTVVLAMFHDDPHAILARAGVSRADPVDMI